MGVYLNGTSAYGLFREDFSLTYYVDKTEILAELVPLIELKTDTRGKNGKNKGKGLKYVAITRPRRFGKTVMANMIASYFGKGVDSHAEFDALKVSRYPWYKKHLNQHNVIHIVFNELPLSGGSYEDYIRMINSTLLDDLAMAYPNVKIRETDSVWRVLTKIYEYCGGERFIFVLDEWDYIYHQDFATDENKENYTRFLSNLLKDRAYVEMVYMTGILPIAKYSSGSELNMFCEYTMVTEEKYSAYFGFIDSEVDELFYYVGANVDQVKDDVGLLLADIPVPAKVREYAATSMELKTRNEIFSAMVVYGFLNYENGCVFIPNRELMDKFAEMAQKEVSLGNVYRPNPRCWHCLL